MIGRTLSHYRITDRLGVGGMGEVYRATDTKLGRDVALKVLPSHMASSPERLQRFQREARAVAALNHPNIVTIHSVEESDGIHFITMELVEGVSLDRLIAEKGLALKKLLEVAIPLVEAISAAHDRGITHRDLKPANIMVGEDGRLKVLDFGLAKLQPKDSAPGQSELPTEAQTQQGLIVGTIPYMSPEQVESRAVDHRTDIFSLGVLLYEMATGSRPFQGRSTAALMSSILKDEPPPVTAERDDLPREFGSAILRCLEKDPADRFQSAREVQAELRHLDEQIESGTSGTPSSPTGGAPPSEELHAIAVLPFANLSPDPSDELFSDGMTEEIIAALGGVPGLRVAARTSAFSFKGKSVEIAEVAERLNVSTILEGSVRRAGQRVRITAQLVNVADGYHLWSQRFDRELDDIFAVQDEIATAIANRFREADGGSDEPLVRAGTRNLKAYELYLKGRDAWRRFGTSLDEALQYFERAVSFDPDFGAAHAAIADTYGTLGFTAVMPPHVAMPKAKAAAERALAIDDRLAEAHCALAYVHMLYEWDWKSAEAGFLRSMELNPNYPQAMHHYGHLYHAFVSHKLDEGIALCRLAVEVDPLAGYPRHGWFANLYIAGRTDEAIDHLEKALAEDPNAFHLRRLLALCYWRMSQLEESRVEMEAAVRTSARHPWALSELGCLHAYCGRVAEAEAIQAELVARSKTAYVQGSILSLIPAWLGDLDESMKHCQDALDERDGVMIAITSWPTMEPAWQHPRYPELLERLGLAEDPNRVGAAPPSGD